jgi:polyphosphate kinase 2 (PPK2 family)
MFKKSSTKISPWINVKSNNKLKARIESIKYVLSRFEISKKGIVVDNEIITLIK